MKLSLETLRAHLAGEPARAYLVSGDEALLVGEAADAIRARVKRAGFDEREVHFIERVADWDAVRASANNLSLFGSRKLIEIRLPSGKPGVGGANAIVDLLANVSPDNVYLMLTGKLEREQNNSAWVKAFENAGAWLAAWPVELARLPQWLRARAATLELELEDDAVQIHRRTHRRQSARRASGTRETQDAGAQGMANASISPRCRRRIGDSARFDVFQLGEAALGADVPRALRILAGLRSEGVEPTLALWSIAREIRNVWGTTQQGPRAAGRSRRPRSKTPSAARPNFPMRGSRREPRAPIA